MDSVATKAFSEADVELERKNEKGKTSEPKNDKHITLNDRKQSAMLCMSIGPNIAIG